MDYVYDVMRSYENGSRNLPTVLFPDSEEHTMRGNQQPSQLDELWANGLVHRETTIREMRRLLKKPTQRLDTP